MTLGRIHSSPPCTAALALVLAAAAGCGKAARSAEHEAAPGRACERATATYHDGSRPTKRTIAIPPPPGLRAVAITEHTTRLEWSFADLPSRCRPVAVLLSVRSTTDPPTTEHRRVHGQAGRAEITYPEFLPAPELALASAFSEQGHRSRTVTVPIERSGNVTPDPAPPPPRSTAPAGRPIACSGSVTVVADPAGDVLTHQPGSPPARVERMTPELAAIDLTRAAVQIDGRTMCATFELARAPGASDFGLILVLRDTTTSACCAALHFRRTAGRLELGYLADDGGTEALRPVSGGGALVRGTTLLISGTLPPPSAWRYGSQRLPAAEHLGWSVTTEYAPETYGPAYGDWLPAHAPFREPIVRHRDGAVVRPGPSR